MICMIGGFRVEKVIFRQRIVLHPLFRTAWWKFDSERLQTPFQKIVDPPMQMLYPVRIPITGKLSIRAIYWMKVSLDKIWEKWNSEFCFIFRKFYSETIRPFGIGSSMFYCTCEFPLQSKVFSWSSLLDNVNEPIAVVLPWVRACMKAPFICFDPVIVTEKNK